MLRKELEMVSNFEMTWTVKIVDGCNTILEWGFIVD